MVLPEEHFLISVEHQLRAWFGDQPVLARKELLERVAALNPALKKATLDVYLHRLTLRNQLVHAGRGVYALPDAPRAAEFAPSVPPELVELWQAVAAELFLDAGCVWPTQWLNDFTSHQVMRTVQLVEVEPAALDSTYYALKDRLGGRVFLAPDARVLELYVAETPDAVLVLPLVSRAPLQLVSGTPVPRLEKILVDLLSEPVLLASYQGEELRTIYRTAARRYRLDARTLHAYARRRGKAPALRELLLAEGLSSLLPQ
ncbi:hypothetical protein I2I05_19765 [Hymenobacter sp. BT683]|uniref:Transcriptional regulator n=1 Tax=Hymenobacter jeongseonensis TaxID=2791027 RepID=A0ABS0IMP9_9BACT|nr:DUF6577 family protein [Hymenobacter jeongseonensis]MBF9239640.1 hypothetical protein [Hymenobacter jeongseonensis]